VSEPIPLAALLDQATDGLLAFDAGGAVLWWNRAFAQSCDDPRGAVTSAERARLRRRLKRLADLPTPLTVTLQLAHEHTITTTAHVQRHARDEGDCFVALIPGFDRLRDPADHRPEHRLDAIVAHLAIADAPDAPDARLSRGIRQLSPREREILDLLLDGLRVGPIGRRLAISPHTVRNHIKAIFRKLGVHSQADLLDRLRRTLDGWGPGVVRRLGQPGAADTLDLTTAPDDLDDLDGLDPLDVTRDNGGAQARDSVDAGDRDAFGHDDGDAATR
jgi:DNA-binding CsgD family transcriptional regulator